MSGKKEDRLLLQKILGVHFKKNRQKLNLTQEKLEELSHLTVRNYSKIEKVEVYLMDKLLLIRLLY